MKRLFSHNQAIFLKDGNLEKIANNAKDECSI